MVKGGSCQQENSPIEFPNSSFQYEIPSYVVENNIIEEFDIVIS